MVARFDVQPDCLQAGNDLQFHLAGTAPAAFEVAARVVGQRPNAIALRKEEELDLGRDQVFQPRGLGLCQQAAQPASPVTGVRLAAGRHHLADESGTGQFGRRLDYRERRWVRAQEHVRLDLAGETLDGRTVEPLPGGKDGL